MNILTLSEMTDMLTDIYDNRLRSLIGYSSKNFTRELVEYMFEHFAYITLHTDNSGFYECQVNYITDILSYNPGDSTSLGGTAASSSIQLTMSLENYIRSTVGIHFPDWKNYFKDDEYRKALGMLFTKEIEVNPHKYPEALSVKDFFSQLNYTTLYRNKVAHKQVIGKSGVYHRHIILEAYDVLLSYLLYTFYSMSLTKTYTFKHIKD